MNGAFYLRAIDLMDFFKTICRFFLVFGLLFIALRSAVNANAFWTVEKPNF